MTFMGKLGWIVSLVLAVGLAVMSYLVVIRGTTAPYADGRTTVLLTADQRNAGLAEMRGLLESLQQIMEDTVAGDYSAAAELATSQGMAAFNQEDPAVLARVPLGFKTMGMAQRQAFDDLAKVLKDTNDPVAVFDEMSTMVLTCTACHQTYRLGVEGADKEAQ